MRTIAIALVRIQAANGIASAQDMETGDLRLDMTKNTRKIR